MKFFGGPPKSPSEDVPDLLPLAQDDLAQYGAALVKGFQLPRHLQFLVEVLERVARGEIKRVLISMPPRHGKTTISSVIFPAWILGRRPTCSVILSSYAQEVVEDTGRKVRNLVADPRHGAIFGRDACLSGDATSVSHFAMRGGGQFFAVGRGASITGRGADYLILDDMLKDREEASSETIRRQLHAWYRDVAHPRLEPGGAVVVVGTRWHERDLHGFLLEEAPEENWTVVNFPALAEEADPLGRVEGEPLWPERYGLGALLAIKSVLRASWSGLFQQRPAAVEGETFKRSWWRLYKDVPADLDRNRITMSLDTAFSEKRSADYSALTVWGEARTGFYLLFAWRAKVGFPDLKKRLVSLAEEWRPHIILIENRASGQSLLQELQRETNLPIKSVDVSKDKTTRAAAVTPTIENGRVYLPEGAPFLPDYLDELSVFPSGRNDDWVDSTSMALDHMRGGGSTADHWNNFFKGNKIDGMIAAGQFENAEEAEAHMEVEKRAADDAFDLFCRQAALRKKRGW